MGLLQHHRRAEWMRRLLAAGCIALVFALGVFASSPTLHEQLHHDNQVSADDGCAIVLFAGGVSVPLAPISAPPAPLVSGHETFSVATELLLDSPRYLLLPGRGPPLA